MRMSICYYGNIEKNHQIGTKTPDTSPCKNVFFSCVTNRV